jgi:hypothetical protein
MKKKKLIVCTLGSYVNSSVGHYLRQYSSW